MAEFRNSFPPARTGSLRRFALTRHGLAAAIGLALVSGGPPAVAAGTGPEAVGSDDVPQLFSPIPATDAQTQRAQQAEVGREAVQLNRTIANLPLQGSARLSLPSGVSYELIYDNRVDHPSGNVTWTGYLKDYGDDYRAVITFGAQGVSGRILTPDGEFLIESDVDGEWLIDTQAAGLIPAESGSNDALIPIPEKVHRRLARGGTGAGDVDGTSSGETSGESDPRALVADPNESGGQVGVTADTTLTTIDVMILYTPGLASRLGGGLSARLDQLVALSNQAYRDSGVYINLRLVAAQQVNYSDTTTNTAALDALTKGTDPTLANVASLRNTYGADLVSLIRPFNYSASGGSCGVAWVIGASGQSVSSGSGYGYSVIGDGKDVNNSGYYCHDLSFTHELGHNMGSVHDRANSSFQGAYAYSYGYGVSGTFGTVMSYINPRIAKFSNPSITCAGGIACGVSESAATAANNTLSLNNTRAALASFRAAQQTPPPSPPPPTAYLLTVTKSGGGTVTGVGINCGSDCNETYASGTQVILTASPASGNVFSGWSGACGGTGSCSVTMSAAKNITATFTALPKYSLTVTKSGSGTVTGAGISCGSDCSEAYVSGTTVTLTASPDSGYQFSGWSGVCTGTGSCVVTMNAARNITATFTALPKYSLTVTKSGSGTITGTGISCGSDCSEAYVSGTTATLKATPASGYRFTGWTGSCTGTATTCTVTMSGARSVTATFKR